MRIFDISEAVAARRDLFVQMVDLTDGYTAETGLTPTVQIVKAGGSAYAGIAGSCAEIGSGTYKISLAAGDLDTEGEAMLKITAAGARDVLVPIQVTGMVTQLRLVKAMLLNLKEKTLATGALVVYDDTGLVEEVTLTPTESGGVLTVTPSYS